MKRFHISANGLRTRSLQLLAWTSLVAFASAQTALQLPPPAPVGTNASTDAGADVSPRLVHDGVSTWTCVWQTTDSVLTVGGDSDIVWARSRDDGFTWSAPQRISPLFASDTGTDAVDIEPAIGHVGADRLAVWASTRGSNDSKCTIYRAQLLAGATTWSTALPISALQDGDAEDDREPSVIGGNSQFIVVWQRDGSAGERDIFYSRSIDSGANWSNALRLTAGMATDTRDDRHADVGTTGGSIFLTVWDSTDTAVGAGADADIFAAWTNGAGWTAPITVNTTAASDGSADDSHPSIAHHTASDTWVCVWQTSNTFGGTSGGDVEIAWSKSTSSISSWTPAAILNADFALDAAVDSGPSITIDDKGQIFVCWSRRISATDSDIYFVRSNDVGVTWSAPTPLQTNATTDSGVDSAPRLAADPFGHWVGAWTSTDPLGGTIGVDADVLAVPFLTPHVNFISTAFCFGYVEVPNASRCPCGNDGAIATGVGCANSSGVGAKIEAVQALTASAGTRFLRSSGVPAGSAVLSFQGTAQQSNGLGTTFGDGRLCVGGSILRLGVSFADAAGVAVEVFMPTTEAQVVAGDTRFYQGWYRDSASFCTSATFNLTSAIAAVWRP